MDEETRRKIDARRRRLRKSFVRAPNLPTHLQTGSEIAYGQEPTLDEIAMATALIPGIGDATGLLADAEMYWNNPEERTLTNAGLTAAGLLPGVPNAVMSKGLIDAIGGAALGTMASIGSKTADLDALAKAKRMAGGDLVIPEVDTNAPVNKHTLMTDEELANRKFIEDPDTIWEETGWQVDSRTHPDLNPLNRNNKGEIRPRIDRPLYEISDADATLNKGFGYADLDNLYQNRMKELEDMVKDPDNYHRSVSSALSNPKNVQSTSRKLGEFLRHGKLYDAYPELVNMPVKIEVSNKKSAFWYNDKDMSLGMNLSRLDDAVKNEVKSSGRTHEAATKSIIMHEVQHAVQDIESLPQGTTPYRAKGMKNYLDNAGEVQGRNSQRRMDFSDETRREYPPWLTMDRPQTEQWVDEWELNLKGK